MRLELRDVSLTLAGTPVLRDMNLATPESMAIAVVGPSGGGKTTLLRLLAGLIPPQSGEIRIDGELLPADPAGLLRHRRSVGTVFQAYNLFPHLTALENVTLPLEKVHGHPGEAARQMALTLLERPQLSACADRRPAALSGGQQQRIAIARALAIQPRFFLFDEPTSALDPEMTAEVLDLIMELRRDGRHLLLVTHHLGFARSVADHLLFVSNGRIAESGPAAERFAAPHTPELQHFFSRVLRY